jgi:hypothetical protein
MRATAARPVPRPFGGRNCCSAQPFCWFRVDAELVARPTVHERWSHVRSYKSIAVGYTVKPSIRFFPLRFPEGTENGELHTPTEADRDGHGVWRHSVPLGRRYRPVLALAGDCLAHERRWVLAHCLLCDFGRRPDLASNFFVKGQNCTRLGMANTYVDMAVFPTLANG